MIYTLEVGPVLGHLLDNVMIFASLGLIGKGIAFMMRLKS